MSAAAKNAVGRTRRGQEMRKGAVPRELLSVSSQMWSVPTGTSSYARLRCTTSAIVRLSISKEIPYHGYEYVRSVWDFC